MALRLAPSGLPARVSSQACVEWDRGAACSISFADPCSTRGSRHPIDAAGEEPDDAYEREMCKRGLLGGGG